MENLPFSKDLCQLLQSIHLLIANRITSLGTTQGPSPFWYTVGGVKMKPTHLINRVKVNISS